MKNRTNAVALLAHLESVNGIGPKTIKALEEASLTKAGTIRHGGLAILKKAGLGKAAAKLVLDNLPASPKSPKKAKKAKKATAPKGASTAMGQALQAAAKENGVTVAQLAADLPQADPEKIKAAAAKERENARRAAAPKKAAKPTRVLDVGVVDKFGGILTITNPVQIRQISDLMEMRLDKDVAEIAGVEFIGAVSGKPVALNEAWVVKVSAGKKTILKIVSRENMTATMKLLKAQFPSATVTKLWLRKAIEKLFAGWRRQLKAAEQERAAVTRTDDIDKLTGEMVELMLLHPSDDASPWLTEEQIAAIDQPLEVPTLMGAFDQDRMSKLGLLIPEKAQVRFGELWGGFMENYLERLIESPELADFKQLFEFVNSAFDAAQQQRRMPYLPLQVLRVFVRTLKSESDSGWRAIVVHRDLVDQLMNKFEAEHGFRLKYGIFLRDYLVRRRNVLLDQAEATFKETDTGKSILAAFSFDDDAAADADADLIG